MFSYDDEQDDTRATAQDTPLTEELQEHLQREKERRLKLIAQTHAVSSRLTFASLNATGYFIARWLLLIGGSTNIWLAASLCFSLSSAMPLAKMAGFRASYREGVEVEGIESLIQVGGGLIVSGVTTAIAVQPFFHYQSISDETVYKIEQDIREIDNPGFDITSDTGLVTVVGVLLVVLVGFKALFSNRN